MYTVSSPTSLEQFPRAAEGTDFPGAATGKETACQRRLDLRVNPWVQEIPWRREWQFTPVFMPGESHEQRSLVGYSLYCCTESDTTEVT